MRRDVEHGSGSKFPSPMDRADADASTVISLPVTVAYAPIISCHRPP